MFNAKYARMHWPGELIPALFLVLASLSLLPACSSSENTQLDRVKAAGEIVVLTRRSPSTYTETPDGPIGFEHDLVKAFATSLGVQARFLVADRHANILPQLTDGAADMAAAGIAVTPDATERFRFTPPYQQIKQQVVYRLDSPAPIGIAGLVGRQIEVHTGTNHAARLRELQETYPGLKWTEVDDRETEELLGLVWDGLLETTIANSHIIALNRQFFPELQVAFDLSPPESLAWAFPKSDDESLYQEAVKFLKQYRAAGELERLLDRYYGPANRAGFVNTSVYHARIRARLPQYQLLFEKAGQQVGLDWRLIAALGYQESFWDPKAISPTGVRGMMMLTEDTAQQVGVTELLDAEQSIVGGARYLRDLYERMNYIALPDRTWFALAAYNVGFSHLEDARILTQRQGKDPSKWSDVKDVLPLLEQPRWYNRTRYGFARGSEPVLFVARVRTYYDILVKLDEQERSKLKTDALKLKIPSI
jgi:membrane-bound lytic murein transglycosylase F